MNICVVGAGYVGLVTSACLAYLGNEVIAVESNEERLANLQAGLIPFYEPHLSKFVTSCVSSGNLTFGKDISSAVRSCQIVFIAVGTPSLASGEPDLSQVMNVARSIGSALDAGSETIIVNKSTVPVGSGNWVEMLVNQGVQNVELVGGRSSKPASPGFAIISNPEFLREGSAISDSFYPDRIVLGAADDNAVANMKALYEPILTQSFDPPDYIPRPHFFTDVPLIVTDLASAELIKYSANAFLAMKISFANEIAGLCEKVGADVRLVTRGIGLDNRIGSSFLNSGIGWGGSCFGKDINALIEVAREYSYPTPLLESILTVNARQRLVVIKKLQEELKIIKGRTISLMGLSFKPNTDDLRDAPSLTIAAHLLKMGATVKAYDPVSNKNSKKFHPDLELVYCNNLEDLAFDADALVLVTEWDEFKQTDWSSLAQMMRYPLLIDGRNILDERELKNAGMIYRGIGH